MRGALDLTGGNTENDCDCVAGRKGALRVVEEYTCPQMLNLFLL